MAYYKTKSSIPNSSNTYRQNRRLFHNGFDLEFLAHPSNGDLVEIRDELAIKQSIENLIMMNRFDKPFQPEIFTGIRDLLFEPFNDGTNYVKNQLERRITEIIKRYEPRVILDKVVVQEEVDTNSLVIDVFYTIIGLPWAINTNFIIERSR